MTRQLLIEDMEAALSERLFPSVTVWNRVEPRPRSVEFDRALHAEVRDALWMVARQWQLGEFRGDDAGTPVSVQLHLATTRLTRYRPGGGASEAFDDAAVPLEADVERRRVPFSTGGDVVALDLRLVMGRQWLKMVDAGLRDAFVERWGFTAPDPDDPADVELVSHPEVWATLQAVAGRAVDGYRLWEHLTADASHHPYDDMPTVPPGDHAALDDAATRFLAWFAALVAQPDDGSAWDPSRLEHRFDVAAPVGDASSPAERVLEAVGFPGGHLDWPAFTVATETEPMGADTDTGVQSTVTRTMLPAPVAYDGMPDPRWWAFEDGRTSFAGVRADTTDLAKLVFTEFALVFSNDWFLVPCDLVSGTVAKVRGLAVTNVFGERLWVEPAGAGADEDWQRWSMFTLDVEGSGDEPADTSLLLLPAVPKANEGAPLEQVTLVRDEMANMVWGVEKTVPMATGDGRRGAESAAESLAWRRRLLGAAPPPDVPSTAPVRYRVMNTVPEYWIPFVPVHVEGSNRQVQLQRAAMPRILEGDPDPPVKVRPRTSLLRHGLDADPPQPYYVHEEEVPRSGTTVSLAFRRTRWSDGRAVVWLGAKRHTGRGEASSRLAFDYMAPREVGPSP
jgi:hypothetical protein